MRKKKIIYAVIFSLLVYLAASLSVSAHRGRTDAYGGHYDNETGEYHYHHGYPAHEHINGECPYAFNDQTNYSSGSASNSTATKKPEYHIDTPDPLSPLLKDYDKYSSATKQKNVSKEATEPKYEVLTTVLGFCLIPIFFTLIASIAFIYDMCQKRRQNKERQCLEIEREKSIVNQLREYSETILNTSDACNKQFIELCNSIFNLNKLSELLPINVSIDMNKLLYCAPTNIYNVFVAKKGSVIHKREGCSGAFNSVHILKTHTRRRCKRCFSDPTKYIDKTHSRNIIDDIKSSWYFQCVDIIDDVYSNEYLLTDSLNYLHKQIDDCDECIQSYQNIRDKIQNNLELCKYIKQSDEAIAKIKESKNSHELLTNAATEAVPPKDTMFFAGLKSYANRILIFNRTCSTCHKSFRVIHHFSENQNSKFPLLWRCQKCKELTEQKVPN